MMTQTNPICISVFLSPDMDFFESQGVFNNTFERRGIQCMVERCLLILILYYINCYVCLLSLLGGRGLWPSIDWPDNVWRCSMWVHRDKVIAVITGNEQFAHDE